MATTTNIQAGISARKKRLVYLTTAIIIVILAPIVYFYLAFPGQPSQPRAAIIDQLGSSRLDEAIRHENESFIETTREFLYKRFSAVDYYSDNATIEQYRQLGSANYKLIVWRAHSALDQGSKYVAISSTEKYAEGEYDEYLDTEQLTLCNITGEADIHKMYLGITPKFIREVMNGRFEDTVIILMSCNGLRSGYHETARAFEEKGVRVLISWDEWVSSFDNDDGAGLLLQHLINENDTVSGAVGKTPTYSPELGGARLMYDPSAAADYRIPDYRQNESAKTQALVMPSVSRKGNEPRAFLVRTESRQADS